MPRTNLGITHITRSGVAPPAAVAGTADGAMFANDGGTFLEVANVNATVARSITFETPGTVGDRQIEDLTLSIPAASTRYIGTFPHDLYNRRSGQTDSGMVYVNFDAAGVADLTVRAYRA